MNRKRELARLILGLDPNPERLTYKVLAIDLAQLVLASNDEICDTPLQINRAVGRSYPPAMRQRIAPEPPPGPTRRGR